MLQKFRMLGDGQLIRPEILKGSKLPVGELKPQFRFDGEERWPHRQRVVRCRPRRSKKEKSYRLTSVKFLQRTDPPRRFTQRQLYS